MRNAWHPALFPAPDDKARGREKPEHAGPSAAKPPGDERFIDVGPGLIDNAHDTGGKGTLGIVEGSGIPGSEGGG